MLLTRPATVQPLQQQNYYCNQPQQRPQHFCPQSLDFDLEASFSNASYEIRSSSPLSHQSALFQHYSLTTQPTDLTGYDSSHLAVPRKAAAPATTNFGDPLLSTSLSQEPRDHMPADAWAVLSHYAAKSGGRFSHQRESSLSSLGSAGPASPFNHNISNPHIAVTDSTTDAFQDMQSNDGNSLYQLAKSMPSTHDNIYPNYNGLATLSSDLTGYTSALAVQRPRSDRGGLLPAPELSATGSRSHPVSVASSVASDSPATPSMGEHDDDRRRKAAFSSVPKLDRTITDIYNDELYSPNFVITSAAPAQSQAGLSPCNDVFAQRLHAANNQHLSAAQSPVSSTSRGRSPFRQGSPLAPVSNHDFGAAAPASQLRFNSAHQMRERRKVEQDAQIRNQLSMKSEPETPKTISPKDAMLEIHDTDGENSFPLFPPQEPDFDGLAKAVAAQEQNTALSRPSLQNGAAFPYLSTQLPNGIQVPQQYPFIAHPPRTQEHISRLGSAESTTSAVSDGTQNSHGMPLVKPAGATADGGTYTCTYHGCILRFETPALLQKHKREGHRQTQAIGGPRRVDAAVTSPDTLLNSQAGPHRCDRINPSTGKPCQTIFSRPYDLTRHEDTIHNARKQKVRCNLCSEEKTFSRADALTRHYRVCHPDVEFPGKHRRRGNNI
ncbi:hypothetical protein CSOJ01_00128 [Colletotrichum sojae]|uniref:C2H2-type domain-containing protein n=1 Tax=Colletotrichum sojae TaxID=2175907 RepID=A0A8H6JZH1_9PEZI|nr:hypothetical protein CSOJ01_00128 [Colletotrichum sojae]